MTTGDYDKKTLLEAIKSVGIIKGDTVSLQVSLGRLGRPRDLPFDFDVISKNVIECFVDVIGPDGTLIVPTYSYSIGRGEIFDIANTPSSIGGFSEYFRKMPNVIRSRDPMLSHSGYGPSAKGIFHNISNSCYGNESVFHRLRKHNAKICVLGISLYWATFRHHIEEMAAVPFRYKKIFQGLIRNGEEIKRESWIYFCAPLLKNCQPNGLPLENMAFENRLITKAKVGRSELMVINSQKYFDFGYEELLKNPWLTAEGPSCTIEELINLEDQRIGAHLPKINMPANATSRQMIENVWRLPRDLISDGYDAALYAFNDQFPMTIHTYPTGTECWSWIVPEKWQCKEAYLTNENGDQIISKENNILHIASYSHSFEGVLEVEDLKKHILTHPVRSDLTPYHYLFYKKEWALCSSQILKESLKDKKYYVKINTDFSYGALKVGEIIIPGKSEESIIICGHLDHPGQVNDGLSGVALGIDIMRTLAELPKLNYTYRMIIVPETIGSIAWLSHNENLISKIKAGIFLEMVGLNNRIFMQHSYNPESLFDKCAIAVLKNCCPDYQAGKFLEVVTNDDRQFNAPGVRVPMISLSRTEKACGRTGVWQFDEYHSENDNIEMLDDSKMAETKELVLKIIDCWDNNYIPIPQFYGEVFLSRYSIYYDYDVDPDYGQALFETMHALDGQKSIVEISLSIERNIETVNHIIEQFRKSGLVIPKYNNL